MSRKKGKKSPENWPEAERQVHRSYEFYSGGVNFIHHSLRSRANAQGKDFWVKLIAFEFGIDLQIKPTNSETRGFVLPLEGYKEKPEVSPKMQDTIDEHLRKHPDVRFILFVQNPRREKDKRVLMDIWKETINLFKEAKRRGLV